MNLQPACAQWTAQDSGLPGAATITAIDIVNANVAWAVAGNRSAPQNAYSGFTRTTDGLTWGAGTIPTTGRYFVGLSAVDAANAWVIMRLSATDAGGSVYHTTDGGQTWNAQTAFASAGSTACGIHFFDLTHGVVVGNPNGGYFEVCTTADGGANWQRVPAAALPTPLAGEIGLVKSVVGTGNTLWFGTSSGRVFRSTNQGLTWQASTTPLPQVGLVAFNDDLSGLAINTANSALDMARTRDGGVTWQSVRASGQVGYPSDCAAVPGRPGTHVVARGANPSQWGTSYSVVEGDGWSGIDNVFHGAVAFLDAKTGWSGGAASAANRCIIYKGSVPDIGDCISNLGGGNCDISQVQIVGTSLNTTTSRCQPGQYFSSYPMAGTTTARLLTGGAYQLRVTCSRAVNITAYFDTNTNGVFDNVFSNEMVGFAVNVPANTPQLFNFYINRLAPAGVNLLRIRTSNPSSAPFAIASCGLLTSGETRDYFLTTGDFQNNSYSSGCQPAHVGNNACLGTYIQTVQLVGTTLNNSSGCLPTGGFLNQPYTQYAASGSATGTVQPGATYTLRVTSPFEALGSVWFDWNRDDVYSANEWFQLPPMASNQPVSLPIQIPATLLSGPLNMRVRASALGELNNANAACSVFQYGETEDYILNAGIVSASQSAQQPNPVTVYPNPTKDGQVSLAWQGPHASGILEVINGLGQRVQVEHLAAQQPTQELNLTTLPVGIYTLKVSSGQQVWVMRLVRQ